PPRPRSRSAPRTPAPGGRRPPGARAARRPSEVPRRPPSRPRPPRIARRHEEVTSVPRARARNRRRLEELSMDHAKQFYINGQWVAPLTTDTLDVINPATEEPIETIAMGGPEDVDAAVAAAKA